MEKRTNLFVNVRAKYYLKKLVLSYNLNSYEHK